ncbi:MAG: hypothetical protein JNN15_09695 [Blastocatellia bacterium]|nr:hypothetical protein [Blastocatellia bacterium]
MSKTLDICRELYNADLQDEMTTSYSLSLIKIKLNNYQQSKKVEQMLNAIIFWQGESISCRGILRLEA